MQFLRALSFLSVKKAYMMALIKMWGNSPQCDPLLGQAWAVPAWQTVTFCLHAVIVILALSPFGTVLACSLPYIAVTYIQYFVQCY